MALSKSWVGAKYNMCPPLQKLVGAFPPCPPPPNSTPLQLTVRHDAFFQNCLMLRNHY